MKRAITIAAMLAAAGLAGAQMFAQLFGTTGTPIPAVAWYKLDGNALDSSGNGYDGTWSGTAAYAAGKFAGTQAASFNGSSNIGATNLAENASSTVAMWIKSNRFLSTSTAFFLDICSNQMRLMVASSTVANRLVVGASNSHVSFADGVSIQDEFTHVSYVVSGGIVTHIYVNGLSIEISGSANPADASDGTKIGRSNLGTAYYATGLIDDVRIFDRALSHANIKRIMQGQDVAPIEELQ